MRSDLQALALPLTCLLLLSGCTQDASHGEGGPSSATTTAPAGKTTGASAAAPDAATPGATADESIEDLTESIPAPGPIGSEAERSGTQTAEAAPASLPGATLPEDCVFVTTATGLKYAVLAKGRDGEGCSSNDTVTVLYTGYLTDGTRFDGTEANAPATVPAGNLIEGWKEALGLMTPGTKLKLVIPWKLAYGADGYPGVIPPRADLVFDMELVEAKAGPTPLAVPAFVKPGEGELRTTDSGLQYMVVSAGTGRTPAETEQVSVHYAGWLTDGTLFDNSYARGEPTTFPLNRVIPGWTEGLQLMQEGGTSIFVIPSELAYGDRGAGATIPPGATLIFRVELLKIGG
jgi:peptidylprolyl isomerase